MRASITRNLHETYNVLYFRDVYRFHMVKFFAAVSGHFAVQEFSQIDCSTIKTMSNLDRTWHILQYHKDHDWLNKQHFLATVENNNEDHLAPLDPCQKLGPNNYQWTPTPKRTHKNNKIITLHNETKTLVEWCEQLNLDYNTVQVRLQRGKPPTLALTPTPKPFTTSNHGRRPKP